jgi:hypothetical protein
MFSRKSSFIAPNRCRQTPPKINFKDASTNKLMIANAKFLKLRTTANLLPIIFESYAVVEPLTMVIKNIDTSITLSTVLCSWPDVGITQRANVLQTRQVCFPRFRFFIHGYPFSLAACSSATVGSEGSIAVARYPLKTKRTNDEDISPTKIDYSIIHLKVFLTFSSPESTGRKTK